jgi:hypothetical protein
MEFWPAADCVPDTEFVSAIAFALAPEPVEDPELPADPVALEGGVSTDVNPALI